MNITGDNIMLNYIEKNEKWPYSTIRPASTPTAMRLMLYCVILHILTVYFMQRHLYRCLTEL